MFRPCTRYDEQKESLEELLSGLERHEHSAFHDSASGTKYRCLLIVKCGISPLDFTAGFHHPGWVAKTQDLSIWNHF